MTNAYLTDFLTLTPCALSAPHRQHVLLVTLLLTGGHIIIQAVCNENMIR